MPGNVSQLSNQCVDSPLGNYNKTQICLSSWFESNLSHRSQYVVYNNNSSIFFYITNGVPQGSILGTPLSEIQRMLFISCMTIDVWHRTQCFC